MFSFLRFFQRRPRTAAYTWQPALDLTDPRVSAILKAFG